MAAELEKLTAIKMNKSQQELIEDLKYGGRLILEPISKTIKVNELKKQLEGIPDDYNIIVMINNRGDDQELIDINFDINHEKGLIIINAS